MSRQIRRPDMAVWIARARPQQRRRPSTSAKAYPTLAGNASIDSPWSLAHGITRQESSFEPYAVSHAGARGLMQLMPGTAREQAGKMGVGYDPRPADVRPDLQRDARLGLFPADAQHLGRQRPAGGRQLQRRRRQRAQVDRPLRRPAHRPGRHRLAGSRRSRSPRPRAMCSAWSKTASSTTSSTRGRSSAPRSTFRAISASRARAKRRRWPTDRASSRPQGFARLRAEYEALFGVERPKLVETIAWAAANGDRSENGDYIYGRKRLREIDRRLGYLSQGDEGGQGRRSRHRRPPTRSASARPSSLPTRTTIAGR